MTIRSSYDRHSAQSYDQRVGDLLDDIDALILERLRENAREPATSIAKHVSLTAGAVRRRIERLERLGVIEGYTVVVDYDKGATSIEAYIELSFAGESDVHSSLENAMRQPEVREAMTIAGDPDALVRVCVRDLHHLREVVMGLRTIGSVTGSTTKIVLGRRHRGTRSVGQ